MAKAIRDTKDGETSTSETIQEYASSVGRQLKVDREKGVVYGVKVLGIRSKNDGGSREYSTAAMKGAIGLYEGAPVFVDHQRPGSSRSYHDRNGRLTNPRLEDDGIYADHEYNKAHPITEQYLYDAERCPSNVGFSHDVEGVIVRKNGKVVVEEITKVNSVDLVAKPATTRGLFEDYDLPEGVDHVELCEHGFSAISDAKLIMLGEDEIETKKTRLCEILSAWQSELSGSKQEVQENNTMEWRDITIASLMENRKDLFDSVIADAVKPINESLAQRETALKVALEENAAMKEAKEKAEKAAAITEELRVAGLNVADKVAVSEAFIESLNAAPSPESRKKLIEDRVGILKVSQKTPTGGTPFGSIGDVGNATAPGSSAKETLARLK